MRISNKLFARLQGRAKSAETSHTALRLVVGLGNPGLQYARNRHNVGFMLLDRLAAEQHAEFSHKRFDSKLCEITLEGKRVLLVKPQTYMNSSGSAVEGAAAFYHIPTNEIMIVHDDLDLPLGRLRVRSGGGAGGHHGVESVIDKMGTDEIPRLRIGIGRPDTHEDVGHVLGNFSEVEKSLIEDVLDQGEQALRVWLSSGIISAMNQFNQLKQTKPQEEREDDRGDKRLEK